MPTPLTPWEEMVDQAMDDCIAVFGEGADQVTYTHAGSLTSYTLDGIFEAESVEADPDTGVAVISNSPQISFKLSDMEADPDMNDTIVIRGVTYRVKEPQFDGQGTVTLRLFRV